MVVLSCFSVLMVFSEELFWTLRVSRVFGVRFNCDCLSLGPYYLAPFGAYVFFRGFWKANPSCAQFCDFCSHSLY